MKEIKTMQDYIKYCEKVIREITSVPKCFMEDVEKQQKGCVATTEMFEFYRKLYGIDE